MLYKNDDILWRTPIRFWETQVPSRCVVIGDQKLEGYEQSNGHHLYVHDDEYGHPVYVVAADCWYEKDSAIRAALLHKWMHDMRSKEEAGIAVDRMLAEMDEDRQKLERKTD